MKNIVYSIIIICLTGLAAQDLLKEMEVTINVMDKGVSAQPNTSKIMVKSNILNPSFESNRGIIKVMDEGNGAYTITLPPGNQRIGIKANGYMAYSERHTFAKQKVYECIIREKSEFTIRDIEEDLFETSFIFNVPDVYSSFDDNAPNQSMGKNAIFKLSAGEYTFHFKKDGYKAVDRTIRINKDDAINIELIEDSRQRLTYQAPGMVIINSVPQGAEIILDGQIYGNTKKTLTGITPGKHQLTIGKSRYFSEYSSFEMSSGEVKNINITLKPNFGYLTIKSHPNNAEILVDNMSIGYTPINNYEIESGKYIFSAKKELYHTYSSEEFVINNNDTTFIEFELRSAFGGLEINSLPESGAEVLINGKIIGKTPVVSNKFPSGKYTIELKKKYFSSVSKEIIISDGKTVKKTIILNPNYGTLQVNSNQADIYINDALIEKDSLETRLLPGIYKVRLERDNYYSQEEKITIYAGRTETVNIELLPKQGSVSIVIEPDSLQFNTDILINGTSVGNPPLIKTLAIGSYIITAKLGRESFNQTVNINENTDSPVKFVMQEDGKLVTTQQQVSDTPMTIEQKKKNLKPLYYIAGAVAIGGGAYYYYLLNRTTEVKIDIDFSDL